MTVYVGVDLHSNNNYVGVVNEANAVLFKKQLPNDLTTVLSVLEPFRKDLAGIAVESTFSEVAGSALDRGQQVNKNTSYIHILRHNPLGSRGREGRQGDVLHSFHWLSL